MTIQKANYKSPLGNIQLTTNEAGLQSLYFMEEDLSFSATNSVLENTIQQLHEYFNGQRKFFDIHIDLIGTEFQLKVWNALLKIPFGKTISYLDLANSVGTHKHSRAVGLANGANPISIIIPCHRVIGKNGKLIGYGGGLSKKKWLLDFESETQQLSMF